MTFRTAKLRVLMQEMADLTFPECRDSCNVPLSCCDEMYCEITAKYALAEHGIDLKPDLTQKLPLMGPGGCRVEPYLRPLCTLHTCAINAFGWKPGDVDWTNYYFELRAKWEVLLDG